MATNLPSTTPRTITGFGTTMVLAMAVGSFTTFAVGTLAPFLRADLNLSRAAVGALSTAYFIVGGLASPVLGSLVDKIVSGRRILVALFAVGGLSFIAMALSPGYGWLLVATGLGGLSLAAANPATNQLISSLLPRGRQGVVVGLKQAGGPLGGLFVGVTLPWLAAGLGWRIALCGGLFLAVTGLAATLRYVPPASPEPAPNSAGGMARRSPSANAMIAWLSGYAVLMGAGMASVTAYVPLYAHERVGLSVTTAGMVAAVIGFAGMVSRVLWARHAERVAALPSQLIVLGLVATGSVGLIWAAEATSHWLLWVGAAGFGSSAVAWNAVGMLAIVRDIGPGQAGRASGIVLFAFYAGLIVSPVAFGIAVDGLGAYGPGWAGVTTVCALASTTAIAWLVHEQRHTVQEKPPKSR